MKKIVHARMIPQSDSEAMLSRRRCEYSVKRQFISIDFAVKRRILDEPT
jgi:hypothetical protein